MEVTSCPVYTTEFVALLDGIELSPFMKTKSNTVSVQPALEGVLPLDNLCIAETLYCSYCSSGFLDKEAQRAHYKLDWHRYNLKQALASKKTVSEEKFSQIADDDLSSISGSETEEELETESTDIEARDEERLKHLIARRSRVLFNNSKGQVISVHRCLLLKRKEEAASDLQLIDLMTRLPKKTNWLIVMIGGGHFAAAIFDGPDAVLHKTFHSYTVRAKQGGTQSSKDGKGAFAKSAGASLRRYNEQTLSMHIQELMKFWGPDIVKCDLIFYRAVGPGNSSFLFSGSSPVLLKSDPRLRTIPFPTRRPTFNEVKRVHSLLTVAFVYDSNEMFRTAFSPPVEVVEAERRWSRKSGENGDNGSPRKSNIDRAKERPSPVRELPGLVQQLAAIPTSSSDDADDVLILLEEEEEVSFDHLKEYDHSFPDSAKTAQKKKRKKKKEVPAKPIRPELVAFHNQVHSAKDLTEIRSALETATTQLSTVEIGEVLNERNIKGETLLHKIAATGDADGVTFLLLNGADPCIKDKKSTTPYDHAIDKTTRIAFRRFMGEHPDLHDYSKSHIPCPLTEDIQSEIQEKRRAQKRTKRIKEKEKKAEKEAERKEEEDQQRFLKLSDGDKKAEYNAAKKANLLSQKVPLRCFNCANDMSGKVPFEYNSCWFCSMVCLKAHRHRS